MATIDAPGRPKKKLVTGNGSYRNRAGYEGKALSHGTKLISREE